MKIGIIRCQENSNHCAGYQCFPAMRDKTGKFAGYDTVELVGFDTCGGCGRNKADKIQARALRLKEKSAEVIHLANCLVGSCPSKAIFEAALQEKVGNLAAHHNDCACNEYLKVATHDAPIVQCGLL